MEFRNSTVAGLLITMCAVFFSCCVMAVELTVDVQVNEPDPDSEGKAAIQAETSVSINPSTGTICVGYNDGNRTGYSRSTDGGATFVDGGEFQTASGADSSLVWRAEDESFYYVAFNNSPGMSALWRSADDCKTFSYLTSSVIQGDRPMMAIDNNPKSDYKGRIYLAVSGIQIGHSENGTNWSPPVLASPPAAGSVTNPWPAVDPTTGHVYIAYKEALDGNMRVWVVQSADGGETWSPRAFPQDWAFDPRHVAATIRCDRTAALLGDIFIAFGPQIVVDGFGHLHVVYMRDPDGGPAGDVVDVYYRRSVDQGMIWGPEIRLNDDTTLNDQWNPALSVGPTGAVAVSWYDRRNDQPGNVKFDRYLAISRDNGVTWQANSRVSDVSSSVAPTIDLPKKCYRGEYDQQAQDADYVHVLWSDDRNITQQGEFNPDVWFDKVPLGWLFTDGFENGTSVTLK